RRARGKSALLAADRHLPAAHRRADPAEHLVQRERADRAAAGRSARLLPAHPHGRARDGPARAREDLLMRICFFNRSYWPDQAATGQLLMELAEDLAARFDWQVTVVAGAALNAHPSHGGRGRWSPVVREERRGVGIVRANGTTFRPKRFAARATNYVTYLASAAVASLALPRQDLVVSLTDPPVIGRIALSVARRQGAAVVFLCEDVFPEVAALIEDFHDDRVNRFLDRTYRHLLREADAVVALGDRMRARLVDEKGADPARVHVVHNWADCEAVRPAPKENAFSRAHDLVDKFVVMH